ncbi:immunoglobulin-like domain-containing protein [uncultured Algibacter sp.]|uniref:immunoglobulin-like domain-containing protein n=1 Tax=uncultured Algibacter sp. TaxID=298659 RepID=UPI00263946E4|nr:immunoglobulin-like domain-containing protein [uncultured Algibacter sp.]
MKQLFRKFKQISILILAIAFIGCEDDDAALPTVTAGFTYTLSDAGVATFINISENANKYTWSFGDQNNTASSLIDPVFAYAVGSYTVKLTAINVAGSSDTFESTIMVLDKDAPLIALLGDATINLTLGDTFTDPGATALDEVDGDITANIVVGGDTVDTSTEGTYVITYNVSDAQGNAAIEVERTVIVSAIACEDDTEQTLSAAGLNITFLTDPGVTTDKDNGVNQFFQDDVGYEYVNNPDVDNDVNKSCKVGKVTNGNQNAWDNLQMNFADKFTFSSGDNITMKVYSPQSGYKVTIKLENKLDGQNINSGDIPSTSATTKTNEWEELTFDVGELKSDEYDRIVIFFDLETQNGNTYYFDDLKLNSGGGGGGGNCVPETMQEINSSNLDITFMSDPATTADKDNGVNQFFQDDVVYEYADNPDFSGSVNTSCKVGKVTNGNQNAWDNLQMNFADKFTFSSGDNITMKVYSPQSGYKVTIKLENKLDGQNINSGDIPSTSATTKTNEWEELTFNVGELKSDEYDRIVIFFDLETQNGNTYYFDDLKLNRGSGGGGGGGGGGTGGCTGTLVSATGFPVNFEGCETFMATDGSVKFGDAISAELAANPSQSGINTSDFVLKVDKPAGASHWEGVQNGFPTDFDSSLTFKVKIYTTKPNVRYVFEISNDPNDNGVGNPAGIPIVVANANEWTEVQVTFPNVPPGGHNNFVIKPDDEGSDTVSVGAIHYFDDIRLE